MNKLFIYNPLFRLLSPVFSGVIVYLLILLINNNVEQLQDQFLGQELYFCIGLSYLIQELSIFLLFAFEKLSLFKSTGIAILVQVLVSLFICIVIITLFISIYYNYALGFSPNIEELWSFNSIICSIALIYILLYISHQYLFKVNTLKLENEIQEKQKIEEDFHQFKRGINPDLLFESLETLVVLIRSNQDKTDAFIDHLACIYKHILSNKYNRLIPINKEISILKELEALLNYLPYHKVSINNMTTSDFLIVPNSIISTVEQIVRSTITSSNFILQIDLLEQDYNLQLKYKPNDKLNDVFNIRKMAHIEHVYYVYSKRHITIKEHGLYRIIQFPKLQTNPIV